MRLLRTSGLGAALALVSTAGVANADSGLDSPESGVEQVGRAGAWVARADTPLAAYFNPAALAFQSSGVHVGVQLMAKSQCFTRVGSDGQGVSPGGILPAPGSSGGPPAQVCGDGTPFPNPQIAAAFRLTDKLAIGLAILGPHADGNNSWPESVSYTNKFGVGVTEPAPQRYLLANSSALIIDPTISVAYAVTPELSFGAGFIWGIASASFSTFAEGVSTGKDNYINDVKATLKFSDPFIPGVVLGAMWSPASKIDIAGSFKYQDSIHTSSASLHLQSHYWQNSGAPVQNPLPADTTDKPNAATVNVSIPMEARIGVRFHHPLEGAVRPDWAGDPSRRVRDPMSEDLFDLEVDLSWAHNSSLDALHLTFVPGIAVAGTPGTVPTNGDIPHGWSDSGAVRLGGDYNVLPGRLALRAGGFFETGSSTPQFLTLDFTPSQKIGIAGGASLRLGRFDVAAAYQHTFYATLDNGGPCPTSGTSPTGCGNIKALSGDATYNYRSAQSVNGGKLQVGLNEVGLSGTLHF